VHNNQRSKIEILKSTTLLGGSSLITILIGMVRTKIVAILLGPNGIGFMSVLTSLQQIVSTITGLGLNSSGIRQIAFSASTQDDKAISITVKSLRFTVWATGGLGFLVMVIGAKLFSQASFKTTEYALSIGFLGFAILFSAISSGQSSVLQGFRRIGDVAKINIIGAISGTIISLPAIIFGE
jgi:PST family polysaccharide transporter